MGFFSKQWNPAQQHYSAYNSELLVAYLNIKDFRFPLKGPPFTVFTNHKPSIFTLRQKPDKTFPLEFQHLTYISHLTSDIQLVSGKDNLVVDAFSRISEFNISAAVDFSAFAVVQEDGTVLKRM